MPTIYLSHKWLELVPTCHKDGSIGEVDVRIGKIDTVVSMLSMKASCLVLQNPEHSEEKKVKKSVVMAIVSY